MRADRKHPPKTPLLSTIPVEAPAQVAGHSVLLGVGLGYLETTETGKRICMDLAGSPYDRKLYIWLRDVRRLELEDTSDFTEEPCPPQPH